MTRLETGHETNMAAAVVVVVCMWGMHSVSGVWKYGCVHSDRDPMRQVE